MLCRRAASGPVAGTLLSSDSTCAAHSRSTPPLDQHTRIQEGRCKIKAPRRNSIVLHKTRRASFGTAAVKTPVWYDDGGSERCEERQSPGAAAHPSHLPPVMKFDRNVGHQTKHAAENKYAGVYNISEYRDLETLRFLQ
jgi:hypothetical protein